MKHVISVADYNQPNIYLDTRGSISRLALNGIFLNRPFQPDERHETTVSERLTQAWYQSTKARFFCGLPNTLRESTTATSKRRHQQRSTQFYEGLPKQSQSNLGSQYDPCIAASSLLLNFESYLEALVLGPVSAHVIIVKVSVSQLNDLCVICQS